MSGCAHVCVKCRGPCVEILERVYESPGVRVRARGLGVPHNVGRSESCRARSGQVGCLEAPDGPAASDRARGGGRGQRARPRLCLRRRGPGVRRLCVTLAGVRAGAGKGTGSGGRGCLLRNRPRPLAHWLGAAALWRARREQLVRERRSAKGPASSPGTAYFPPPQPPTAPAFAPWQTSCCSRARPGPATGPTTVHGYRFSQWWPQTPHLQADARLGSRLPTACGNLSRTPPAALLLGFSVSWRWALGEATSLLWSSVFLSVKWGK